MNIFTRLKCRLGSHEWGAEYAICVKCGAENPRLVQARQRWKARSVDTDTDDSQAQE